MSSAVSVARHCRVCPVPRMASADPGRCIARRLPLTDRDATDIRVDGDTDLAQHWLDNTAHVSD